MKETFKIFLFGLLISLSSNSVSANQLHRAAQVGNISELRVLLSQKLLDVNEPDDNGCTALSYAAAGGFRQCLEILISAGADVNVVDFQGDSALTLAIKGNRASVVKQLMKVPNIRCFTDGRAGSLLSRIKRSTPTFNYPPFAVSPFKLALLNCIGKSFGHDSNERDIIDHFLAQFRDGLAGKGMGCISMSDRAYAEEHMPWVHKRLVKIENEALFQLRQLLMDGRSCAPSPPTVISTAPTPVQDKRPHSTVLPFTDLCTAVRAGNVSALQVFLANPNHDLDPNQVCCAHTGRTLLGLAVASGSIDTVALLITSGANVNLPSDGSMPLSYAASRGDVELCELLIHADADIDCLSRDEGQTPLGWAASRHNHEVVALLLAHGANPNHTSPSDRKGDSALRNTLWWATSRLRIASEDNAIKTARVLIEGGAEITPEIAVILNDEEMIYKKNLGTELLCAKSFLNCLCPGV